MTHLQQGVVAVVDEGQVLQPADPVRDALYKETRNLQDTQHPDKKRKLRLCLFGAQYESIRVMATSKTKGGVKMCRWAWVQSH